MEHALQGGDGRPWATCYPNVARGTSLRTRRDGPILVSRRRNRRGNLEPKYSGRQQREQLDLGYVGLAASRRRPGSRATGRSWLVGRGQILVVTARRVAGLAVEDGTLLWDHPWVVPTVPNISQPVLLGDDRVFLSASYGHGAAVIRLTRTSDNFSVETVWHNNRMKNRFSSSVELDGYLYGLDESILACVNAATGELMWKGGRYGYGQLLLAGDHLIVLTENGDLALVRAIPEQHYEVARFEAITGKTWNMPTLADGRLFVRNAREMAAFDLLRP